MVLKIQTNEVKIADLSENKLKIKKKNTQKKNFIIVIGDFYYLDSANNLKLELQKETKINNLLVTIFQFLIITWALQMPMIYR